MKIPCQKCIAYALCRQRTRIACDTLLEALRFSDDNVNWGWKQLNSVLPNAKSLHYEKKKESYLELW